MPTPVSLSYSLHKMFLCVPDTVVLVHPAVLADAVFLVSEMVPDRGAAAVQAGLVSRILAHRLDTIKKNLVLVVHVFVLKHRRVRGIV